MPEYIYLLHPLRHEFFDDPTLEEKSCMEEHIGYLEQAAQDGGLILAGPCPDETFELVIFRAENDQAANAFMHNDPLVRANIMMAELHPFQATMFGRLEP